MIRRQLKKLKFFPILLFTVKTPLSRDGVSQALEQLYEDYEGYTSGDSIWFFWKPTWRPNQFSPDFRVLYNERHKRLIVTGCIPKRHKTLFSIVFIPVCVIQIALLAVAMVRFDFSPVVFAPGGVVGFIYFILYATLSWDIRTFSIHLSKSLNRKLPTKR